MIDTPARNQAMLDEPALLAQRHRLGRLRFSSSLEPGLQDYMHRKMCGRRWPVTLSSLGIMLLFFWVDYRYLPPEIHQISIPLRSRVLVLRSEERRGGRTFSTFRHYITPSEIGRASGR